MYCQQYFAHTELSPRKKHKKYNGTDEKKSPIPELATREARLSDWLCWGLTTRQPLLVILCHLPENRRKEIEEIVEALKEMDREERRTGVKVKKQEK